MKGSAKTLGVAHRMSADDRRDQVLKAAMTEFAIHGLDGTSTEAIAERAGISQPYIFRLWPTKKDLFLAAVEANFDRTEVVLREAVAGNPDTIGAALGAAGHDVNHEPHRFSGPKARLHVMGHAYLHLLSRREALLMQMQAYAACWDDDVRRLVRERWMRLQRLVAELSGVAPDEISDFFARGMLLNVAACMHLPPAGDKGRWAHEVLGFA